MKGIDFLIECLKANKSNEQVYFVIAGSGTEFKKIKAFMDAEKPKNAQLFEQLPKNEYEMLTNLCDVGLIFLDRRFTIPNFPSRLLSYMQESMPVLAATMAYGARAVTFTNLIGSCSNCVMLRLENRWVTMPENI